MDQQLAADILTSDSDEIADLKANLTILEGFIDLTREIDALPDTKNRFYEESRSLYQTTTVGRDIASLEKLLAKFFGPPVKPAGKPLPRKLRKNSAVKYLGGIHKDQSLFLINLKTGQFYGALWPWRRNKAKIEVHLGYCSDWMTDEDYNQLEQLIQQSVTHGAFEQMDANIGGQIHGISLPSFLQMAEMEKSSFTLRVTSRHRVGELHLSDGSLIAAEVDETTGNDAAYRIISWDDASIDIEPLAASKAVEIQQPLMHILMESLKLKDEATAGTEKPPAPPKARPKTKARPVKKGRPPRRLVRLERSPAPQVPRKRASFLTLLAIGVGIFAILAAMVMAGFYYMDSRSQSDGFQELLAEIEKTESLEQKLSLLEDYTNINPKSPHKAQVQTQIKTVRSQIEDRDFEKTTLEISALPVDEQYEKKAISLFTQFLEKYPNSPHTQKINQAIGEIKNLLDQFYYEELKRAARLDFSERLDTYRQYLSKFPQGSYRRDVETLIQEMGRKYLSYLREEAVQCEQKQRWEPCIKHCDDFIEAFKGLELSRETEQLRTSLTDKQDYFQLNSDAQDAGTDYQKAYKLFKAYLNKHPQSTQKKQLEARLAKLSKKLKIQRQWLVVRKYATNRKIGLFERIQKLDQYLSKNISGIYAGDAKKLMDQLEKERQVSLHRRQIEAQKHGELARLEREKQELAQRLLRSIALQKKLENQLRDSSRYHSNGNGTVTDGDTGLTWCLLDSYQELGGCMTYEETLKYVRGLRHGGHSDWRLPTASELASIYKKSPYFPGSGTQWYWTSEAYNKGFHSVVNIVTAKQESVYRSENRSQNECGTVRAVRSGRP